MKPCLKYCIAELLSLSFTPILCRCQPYQNSPVCILHSSINLCEHSFKHIFFGYKLWYNIIRQLLSAMYRCLLDEYLVYQFTFLLHHDCDGDSGTGGHSHSVDQRCTHQAATIDFWGPHDIHQECGARSFVCIQGRAGDFTWG